MANALTLTLPVPTLAVIGLESNVTANVTGALALRLPKPMLSVTVGASADMSGLTLPVPKLALTGDTGVMVGAMLRLPAPMLAMSGVTASVGALSLVMPTPTLTLAGPNSLALVLPRSQLQLVGRTGVAGALACTLPVPVLDLLGAVPFVGDHALRLPVPQIALAGTTGASGRMALSLTQLALAMEGHTGTVGEIAITLPTFKLDLEGHGPYAGALTLTLPLLMLHATGGTSVATALQPDGAVNPAIVMHTESSALTQYTNYPFNSFAMFNGMYLAASAEGLFMIGGATDNGAIINAAARVGMTDFGTSFLKRVDRSYVGYRTDGNLVVRVYTDEVDRRDYLLAATGRMGLHGNHFRIGKGLLARYWQFEVMNQNGADFTLNSIELKPTQLRRRVGGGDA